MRSFFFQRSHDSASFSAKTPTVIAMPSETSSRAILSSRSSAKPPTASSRSTLRSWSLTLSRWTSGSRDSTGWGTQRVRRAAPRARVLALTAHDASELVVAILAAGARGFCLKGGGFEELRQAVHATAASTCLDERVVGNVIDEARGRHAAEQRSAAAAISGSRRS